MALFASLMTNGTRNPIRIPMEPGPLEPQAETQVLSALDALADELRQRSSNRPPMCGLAFESAPDINTEVPSVLSMDPNDPDFRRLSLAADMPVNFPVSNYEQWLLQAKGTTSAYGTEGVQTDLTHAIEREFLRLQRDKVAEWARQKEDAQLRNRVDDLMATVVRPWASAAVDTGKQDRLFEGIHRA